MVGTNYFSSFIIFLMPLSQNYSRKSRIVDLLAIQSCGWGIRIWCTISGNGRPTGPIETDMATVSAI